MLSRLPIAVVALVALLPLAAVADTRPATLTGTVLRRGDRVPLANVTVLLDGDARETTTTDEGRFAFPDLPPGDHRIQLRGPDIVAADAAESLPAGATRDVRYYVAGRDRYTTVVRAQSATREVVQQTLAAEELRRIPGTQGDTLKGVQNLPGVARAAFGLGALIVWGSAPQDTRAYVDGVYIPTLYHFGGLRSTVPSDMVSSLAFTPGAYRIDFGRGLGGLVEVATRRPRASEGIGGYHGFLQLDIIDGSLLVEGPITKKLSFAVAARRSWIDAFLPIFTSNDFQLSPKYWDYQARLQWDASPRDEVSVFFFGSDDRVDLKAVNADPSLTAAFSSHTFFHRGLATWRRRMPRGASLQVTASLGYDVPFQFRATLGNFPLEVNAPTIGYSVRALARVPIARFLRLDAGIDFEGNRWGLRATSPVSGAPREGDTGFTRGAGGFATDGTNVFIHAFAPFIQADFDLAGGRLRLAPALRLEVFHFAGYQDTPDPFAYTYVRLEPRVLATVRVRPWFDLKAALGVYHQAPDPGTFLRAFGNPAARPSYAFHYVVGAAFRPTTHLSIEADAFYKELGDLVTRTRQAGGPPLANQGSGRVAGAQIIVRQQLYKGVFGWVAYTISRSERQDDPEAPRRLFQFDQTHLLTLVVSWIIGRGWQVGARFRFATGSPITPVDGAYVDLNRDFYVPQYGAPFTARIGPFHQLDVRIDKTFTFRWWKLSLYLDLQNLYNRANPEGTVYNFDYSKSRPVSGLPILPVLGVRGEF